MLDPCMMRTQVLAKLHEMFDSLDPLPQNATDVSEPAFHLLATPARPALWIRSVV